MKVALLYIGIGRYRVFWKGFHESAEALFLPGHEKHYFVFTDHSGLSTENNSVTVIHQESLGWPNNTLNRFHMFKSIERLLGEFDYIFFCNANVFFTREISDEILPTKDEGIVVTLHPKFYASPNSEYDYERNPQSTAFIPEGGGVHYVCGGFNGGHAKAYLDMTGELCDRIDEDARNGIIAVNHDESHLNRYIMDHKYKLLSPEFCNPEDWDIPFEARVTILDKSRFGGHNFLRGKRARPSLRKLLKSILSKIHTKR